MKILHTYCLNYNIGDYALGIGLKNLLRNFLKIDFIGNTNIQGRQFTEYYINEVVNKKYDLLVIGGGGIIHGAHWPNGWFWLIDKELIKQIKIPFIVYSAGYNYWENEDQIQINGIEHLLETQKHAAFFSVRNDGSSKRLYEQTGIKACAIPDPGFHINFKTEYKRFIDKPYVIIQLANDKPLIRFGNIEKQKLFIKKMREITKRLATKYIVVFAPHVFDDINLSSLIAKGIKNTIVWDFGYFAFDHTNEAIGYYKYAAFTIAMRGHGQILPISFNVPVISLENHPKHRGLMEELNLLEYNIDINNDSFQINLNSTIDKIEMNREVIIELYRNINFNLWEETQNSFAAIQKALKL